MPSVEKAMAFVMTEVAEAYRAMLAEGLVEETPVTLARIIIGTGDLVEAWLREDPNFVRNNDAPDYVYDPQHVDDLAASFNATMGHIVKREPGKFFEELGDINFMTLVAAEASGEKLESQVIKKLEAMDAKKLAAVKAELDEEYG